MAIPKTDKIKEEDSVAEAFTEAPIKTIAKSDEVVEISPIECFNDFIAIVQFQYDTTIHLTESGYKNEGIVVGVGPGIVNGSSRVKPTVEIGDCVVFGRNVTAELESNEPPYEGKKVIITSERNIICKTRKQKPFKVV